MSAIHSRDFDDAAGVGNLDGPDDTVEPRSFAATTGSERDWPEDASHENGNYRCQCIYCAEYFFGHKRRFICKLCDGKPGETVTSAPNNGGEQRGPRP